MMDDFELFHDTRDALFRTPFGAVASGSSVTLCLSAVEQYAFKGQLQVTVHFEAETPSGTLSFDVPMEKTSVMKQGRIESRFRAVIDCFDSPGVYFYFFVVTKKESFLFDAPVQQVFYGNNPGSLGGLGKRYAQKPEPFQITVYEAGLKVPDDFLSSVIYQIFPDRFCRSGKVDIGTCGRVNGEIRLYEDWNQLPYYERDPQGDIVKWDFYGGDLYGIADKLDYLASLGANRVYLNPIFEAASNHRYDTADYLRIDPILGGEEAFDALLSASREKGISLILDGVFSHTGRDSIYFDCFGHYGGQGAYHNGSSPYRSWYRFRSGDDDDYECWWNCRALPNVNEMDPSYLDFMVNGAQSVLKTWLDRGIYGFRLDVADELPDEFITAVRAKLETYTDPERILIGEVWEDASNKISYGKRRKYFTRRELHGVTNYIFRDRMTGYLTGKLSIQELWAAFLSLMENYPVHNFYGMMNMTGSHDVKRLFTIFMEACSGETEKALAMHRAYAAVLFLFPGIPAIYYGDEICLEGDTDPDNRRTYPWGREPFPQMLDLFRCFGALRRAQPVLQRGILRVITPQCENGEPDGEAFAFERCCSNGEDAFGNPLSVDWSRGESDSIVCVVNRTGSPRTVRLSRLLPGFTYVSLESGLPYRADEEGYLTVPAGDWTILKRTR